VFLPHPTIKQLCNYIRHSITFTFYYDPYSTTPSITSFASTLNAVNTTVISGVTVFYGAITFNATTAASGLGNYFYRNGNVISYNVGGSVVASETSLANVTGVTSPLASSNTFTNTGTPTISYTNNSYANSVTIYANAYNCVGTASPNSSSVAFSVIIDYPSYLLITTPSKYPTTYTAGNAYTGSGQSANNPGRRVNTGATNGAIYTKSSGADSQSFVNTLAPASGVYANDIYDNSWYISDTAHNQELQIVNGLYVTYGYTGAYANYTTYLSGTSGTNLANYSGIGTSGYRYATFAWKCATNASNYNNVTFTVNGLTQTVSAPTTTPTVGGQPIQMFYRIEDTAVPTTSTANFSTMYRNTAWLNVFGQGFNAVTSGNYFNYNNVYSGQNTSLANTYSSGTLTSNALLIPSFTVSSGDNVYIYLRIGLPMSVNVGFSHITATIS
jgi:hypothetical protein